MEFKVLGPLEVTEQGRPLALGGRKRRALLTMLLLRHGQVVSVDALIDGIWGEEAPGGAEHGVQVYVSELRKLLAEAEEVQIVRTASGYVLEIPDETLDVERFERLRQRGRASMTANEPAEAAASLREALELWRGSALADFVYDEFARQDIERLEEARLDTLEDRIDADLAMGEPVAVSELRALVEEHPFRERLRAALMTALYREGRQAEALEEGRRARALLTEDLGIDPGPRLVELEAAILAQDPTLMPERSTADATPTVKAEAAALEPTRKIVSVLVAVLTQTRADGSRVDPEASTSVADAAVAVATPILQRHGASVRALGRQLDAVFGHPVSHEDDAMRAVRAAHELKEALSGGHGSPRGSWLQVQVGIFTGEIVADPALGDGPSDHAVQRAERIAAHAEGSAVLLDATTYALVRHAVDAEAAGRADEGSMLHRSVAVRADAPGIARRIDSPMVGRDDELGELMRTFERARDQGACVLITVSGEAGIGKSRLVDEFARRVAADARVLVGRCLSYGDAITFWPIEEAVREAAAIHDDDDAATVRSELEALVPGVADRDRVVTAMAQILGVTDVALPEGESLWAIRRFLDGLAADGPVVLVIEDIHWAEPTLLDLLEGLVDWMRETPLLVVCTTRPDVFERRPGWGGGRADTAILALRPLSRADTDHLIENLVRHPGLDDEAKARIAEAAEGNPLFVEQLLSMLIDDGLLRQEDGAWTLAADLSDVSLPTSVQTLLNARLDRLPATERSVLGAASVIGRTFDPETVAHLVAPDLRGDVGASLHDLIRKNLVRPERTPEGDAFRFRHALILQAAYEMLPKASRAELHRSLADRLETMTGDRASGPDEIIGSHLALAAGYREELDPGADDLPALREKAGIHLARGAARAFARGDMPAAASLYGTAASLLDVDDPRRLAFLPDLGTAMIEIGRFEDAKSIFKEAIELGTQRGELRIVADATLFRWEAQVWGGDWEGAAVSAEQVPELIAQGEAAGDDLVQQRGWSILGMSAPSCADRISFTQRALTFAERAGDTKGLNENIQMLAGLLQIGPMPAEEALQLAEEYRERTQGDQVMQAAIIVNGQASILAITGRIDEARTEYEWARSIFRELGLPLWLGASGTIGPSWLENTVGDPARAEVMLREGIELLTQISKRGSWLEDDTALLTRSLVLQGRLADAEEALAALAMLVDPSDIWLRTCQGQVALLRGDVEEAASLLRAALKDVDEDQLEFAGEIRSSLAEALRASGQEDEARQIATDALDTFTRKGDVVSAGRVEASLRNG